MAKSKRKSFLHHNFNLPSRKILLAGLIVLLLLLIILEKTNIINLYSKEAPSVTTPEAKTTSTAPTAQEDFTNGNTRSIDRPDKNEGVVQDTGGIATPPDQSLWSSSNDGVITVYTPSKNGIVASGSSLSGASNLTKVSFRLIDDVSGVIAQGALSVVNGKFSGNFSFITKGTNGRLDVFSAAADGVETSNIEIPVRYK